MKRCPTCNETFEEDWLSFCTHDGTTLVDDLRTPEPEPPVIAEPEKAAEEATWNLPVSDAKDVVAAPAPAAVWQPPPPPLAQAENKSLATASMIVGIASMCCLGPIPAIIAIILGSVALSQIKKNPGRIGGRQSAIIGIVTGALGLVIYGGLIIAYIAVAILSANAR